MPHFSNSLPEDASPQTFQLRRTPPKGELVATITSRELLASPIHFFNGRTVPHEIEDECVACNHGRSYRWVAFISCIIEKTGEHIIFETTATAAKPFEEFLKQHAMLRGARFKATRPSGRSNGGMRIIVRPCEHGGLSVPEPPNILQVMEHIWRSTLDIALPPTARRENDVLGGSNKKKGFKAGDSQNGSQRAS